LKVLLNELSEVYPRPDPMTAMVRRVERGSRAAVYMRQRMKTRPRGTRRRWKITSLSNCSREAACGSISPMTDLRRDYISALQSADTCGDFGPLLAFSRR
jgi:hypothetical protein